MISDITIGQFFPGMSPIHRLDPRVKLVMTLFVIVLLFVADNFIALGLWAAFIVFCMLLSKVPVRLYRKSLKPVLIIVLFTAVLNIFYGTGDPLFSFWIFKITRNGLLNSVFISSRIILLILCSSILTFTTSPNKLTEAIERLLNPLTILKVPVHEFAMMMTIALRFIPTLLEETDKIMSAQKARGADLESGGLMQRIRALIPVLVPLFISAFRRAFDLATAMESRCYNGGKGRTKMEVSKIRSLDAATMGIFALALAAFFTVNIIFPPTIVL